MKKEIILILVIIFFLLAILTVIIIKKEVIQRNAEKKAAKFLLKPYEENVEENGDDLYLAQRPDYVAFINEKGKEVFTLPKDKYDYIGQPYENRVLAAKIIYEKNDVNDLKSYKFVKYFLYNEKGTLIKEFDKKNYVISHYKSTKTYTLPSFYYSIAALELADGSYEYIDKNGNEITDNNIIINNRVYSECKKQDFMPDQNKYFSPNIEWIYFKKTMTSPYIYEATCKRFGDKCLGYTKTNYNKNNWQVDSNMKVLNPDFVITPTFNNNEYGHFLINPTSSCDYVDGTFGDCYFDGWLLYQNKVYHFYNGIASVAVNDKREKRFINQKGEFINDEIYEYSEPFYRNLAFVSKLVNDGTKWKAGFINKKGQWVYSWFVDLPKEEQENNKSEKYSDSESFITHKYSWQMIPYDNYAYVSESSNTNSDFLLKGDVITAINQYNFDGLSAEEIDNLITLTDKECERHYNVLRNNENFIISSQNAQCNKNTNYDYNIKFDIYDNYIYVSQSSNPYYDRLLTGDIIISADDYNFQGLSAKEIHDIWQSLKNKKNVYCEVKRGNEILTILKGI